MSIRDNTRLAIFIPSLRGGGAERVMVSLANSFSARGINVDLVLLSDKGPYRSEVSSKVRIVNLNRKRALTGLLPLSFYLRRERPHVMLSALNYTNITAIIAWKLSGAGTRLVVSERSSLTRLHGHFRGYMFRLIMSSLYPIANRVISVSRQMSIELQTILKIPPSQIDTIPNPIDIESIRKLSGDRPLHPWLVPNTPPVILAVGRLVVEKDYPTLLKAFKILLKTRDVRLIILGDGTLRQKLKDLVDYLELAEFVDMPGFQVNPFGWMAASQVYVLSSQKEGFPNTLVQAIACGTPVVSTDCPTGPSEILQHGKWGHLVPVGDSHALANALNDALNSRPCTTPPSQILANFRPEKIVDAYLKALFNS